MFEEVHHTLDARNHILVDLSQSKHDNFSPISLRLILLVDVPRVGFKLLQILNHKCFKAFNQRPWCCTAISWLYFVEVQENIVTDAVYQIEVLFCVKDSSDVHVVYQADYVPMEIQFGAVKLLFCCLGVEIISAYGVLLHCCEVFEHVRRENTLSKVLPKNIFVLAYVAQ